MKIHRRGAIKFTPLSKPHTVQNPYYRFLSKSVRLEAMREATMSVKTVSTISAAERELRERVVADAAHSSAMEGLTAGAEYRADAAAYAAGEFDVDELGRRTRARWGLA